MNNPEQWHELVREAESVKFWRGPVLALGARLPAGDDELNDLLGHLVASRNELAFTSTVFAALCMGRRVGAHLLVEGAALFPAPDLMLSAAWHSSGAVGDALLGAVRSGLMGSERETVALLGAAAWTKDHPDSPLPAGLVSQARLLAREFSDNVLALDTLMVMANLVGEEALKEVLRGYGVPDHPPLEHPMLEHLIPQARRPPIERVPESPNPTIVSGFTVRRAAPRIGRNEPCPCGSGKKYKKCCYEKDQARLLDSSTVPGLTQTELRQQPELALTEQRIGEMRSYELLKIDPVKVRTGLRVTFSDRLVAFGLLEPAVSALEKWALENEGKLVWERLAYEVTRRGNKSLLERLLRLEPRGLEDHPHRRLAAELLLAGDEGRHQLDLVEAAALRALNNPENASGMVELAYALLDRRPALGILAARCAIPLTNPLEGHAVLEELLKARDKLNLPPNDPMCDFIDERLFPPEEPGEEEKDSQELVRARRELQAKVREVRKLQRELDGLSQKLQMQGDNVELSRPKSSRELPPPRHKPAPPEAESTPSPPAGLPESDVKTLRTRIESLKALLKERHNERNLLRRELKLAQEHIESLRQAPPPAARINPQEAEEDLLSESPELAAKQPIRVPEFPRRFNELLASLPSAAARSCLSATGRLAAGEPNAFVGVKRLKATPDVYRQRISDHYRLLFRLHPGRLEVVDLIHRRELERKIKSML